MCCKLDAVWRRDGHRGGGQRRQGVKASRRCRSCHQLSAGHCSWRATTCSLQLQFRSGSATSAQLPPLTLGCCCITATLNAVQTADLGSTFCPLPPCISNTHQMDHQTLSIGEFAQQIMKTLTPEQPHSASICALRSAPLSYAHPCRASGMWNHRFRRHEHIVFDNMSGQLETMTVRCIGSSH